MPRQTSRLSVRKVEITKADDENTKSKKQKAIDDGGLTLTNVSLDKRIMVDASHDVTDGVTKMIEIATTIIKNEPKEVADSLIDKQTFVSATRATPYGASNPYCVANRTDKFALPVIYSKQLFDKAFDLVYSRKSIDSYKIRRSSGTGRLGTRLDDLLIRNKDKDARKIALQTGEGGYTAPHHHHDDLPINTVVLNYRTEIDKTVSRAAERLEGRTSIKPASLTGSHTMAVSADLAEYYQLPKYVIGKTLYWSDEKGLYPYRSRTILTHPLTNYLVSIWNARFSIAPDSDLYSPVITLPNCEDFNKLNSFHTVTNYFLFDWKRFGPSMIDALIIYANSKLASLVSNEYGVSYDWAFTLLNQNTSPQVVEYTDESNRKVAYLNPTAGCLDGISRTSTFNSIFNTYYLFIALEQIGYDINKIKSDDDLRSNDKFGCILVGDGGFVYSKDSSFLSSLKETLSKIGPEVSFGSGLDMDKNVFCGLRFFKGVGFGFNEWSITKLLRPERSAADRKMRPNPRAGIRASLTLFRDIKQDRRLLSNKTRDDIIRSLLKWYDINFNDIDPEAATADISDLAMHYRPGSVDAEFEAEFLSYYWVFGKGEADSIVGRSAARFQHNVDTSYVKKFDKVFK